MMSIEEIVSKDVSTNYPNTPAKKGMQVFLAAIMRGSKYIRVRNTLFLIDSQTQDTVIYHTINGDDLKTFLHNCFAFFGKMQNQKINTAITYFNSPKTLKLVTRYKLPNQEILNSDDPNKGHFMLVTHLNNGGV